MEEKQLPEKRSGRKKWWIIGTVVAIIVVIAVVLGTTLGLLLNKGSGSGSSNGVSGGGGSGPDEQKPYWPGWGGINHLVFFGDSMTSVRFAISGDQPSRENPIGNPDFPGVTSSIAANWVGYMTATYNESFIRTIDLGGGGATVDGAIFRSKFPGFRSFKTQVETDWIPNWAQGTKPSSFDWKQDDTLFISFFGLNDCRDAYFRNKANLLDEDVERYMEILGKLYSSGSRNFLVLMLSPLERAPNSAWSDAERKREFGDLISGYNDKLTSAVDKFSNDNPDAAVFLFDTHSLYNKLLDDPCSYANTCAIKETTKFCPAYANERTDPYQNSPDCAYPLDKYFWINGLHPIFRVHNATSEAIVKFLKDKG